MARSMLHPRIPAGRCESLYGVVAHQLVKAGAPLAALPEAFAPWDSCEPYPTPSCGACPAPAAGALRRASPCAGALRRVRPPRARHPGRGVAAGGCRWRVPGGALPSWRRESAFEFPIRLGWPCTNILVLFDRIAWVTLILKLDRALATL